MPRYLSFCCRPRHRRLPPSWKPPCMHRPRRHPELAAMPPRSWSGLGARTAAARTPRAASLLRPARRWQALSPQCLHKALRQQPASNRIESAADTTLEVLTRFRKAELDSIIAFLPAHKLAPASQPVAVAGRLVREAGPLAACAPFMDASARRVLPGHLLRRCQILSSLQLGDSCQQRVKLTACTGEEVVTQWSLRRSAGAAAAGATTAGAAAAAAAAAAAGEAAGAAAAGAAAGAGAAAAAGDAGSEREAPIWTVEAVCRDTLADSEPPPARPHPRHSPEQVVLAQLGALSRGDLLTAAQFNLWARNKHSGWELQMAEFRALLRQEPYHLLLRHEGARLGAAALPSQRAQLQEALLSSVGGDEVAFVWRLCMQGNGCWLVEGIEAA